MAKNGRELEIVGQIDIQQKIQSFENCALNKILDKFLDLDQYLGRPNMTQSDQIYEAVNYDLADLAEIYEKAEDYKQIFGLDWNLSPNEVFDWLRKNSDQLKHKIEVHAEKMKGVGKNGETQKMRKRANIRNFRRTASKVHKKNTVLHHFPNLVIIDTSNKTKSVISKKLKIRSILIFFTLARMKRNLKIRKKNYFFQKVSEKKYKK